MSVGLDAELRAKGGDVSVLGSLSAAINTLTNKVAGVEKLLRAADARIPTPVEFWGGGPAPASGDFLITFEPGGPPAGRLWHIRSLVVMGSDISSTAPGGTVHVLTGMEPNTAIQGRQAILRDRSFTTLPVTAFYDDYQLTLTYPNKLFLIVESPTASVVYKVYGVAKMTLDHGAGSIDYAV